MDTTIERRHQVLRCNKAIELEMQNKVSHFKLLCSFTFFVFVHVQSYHLYSFKLQFEVTFL